MKPPNIIKATLHFFFILVVGFSGSSVRAVSSNAEMSVDLTTLYRSARKVISDNQELINDASKGDKRLSGDSVVAMTKRNYKEAMGVSIDDMLITSPKQIMLNSVAEVIGEAQELINEKGVGFKGFLPAIFARHVATRFNEKMNGKMKIKLTAPKNYVRNRANRPDGWEEKVIESEFRSSKHVKGEAYYESTRYKGKGAFRYILPEYYGQSCLSCHGSPKGQLDITGGKKEGGVLGELGGAISLVILE
jgi:Protein of unknown function (DUF3365)